MLVVHGCHDFRCEQNLIAIGPTHKWKLITNAVTALNDHRGGRALREGGTKTSKQPKTLSTTVVYHGVIRWSSLLRWWWGAARQYNDEGGVLSILYSHSSSVYSTLLLFTSGSQSSQQALLCGARRSGPLWNRIRRTHDGLDADTLCIFSDFAVVDILFGTFKYVHTQAKGPDTALHRKCRNANRRCLGGA